MFTTGDVKSRFGVDVAVSPLMMTALRTWTRLYMNQADWLTVDGLKSLGLPAAIAGEVARLVTIEMRVVIQGSPRADFLQAQMSAVVPQLRQQVELAAAKGGLMLKPYPTEGGISVDYVQADQFYPIAFDANGNITAAVFSDQRQQGGKWYTRLEYHQLTPEGCVIRNQAFVSDNRDSLGQKVPLTVHPAWVRLQEEAVVRGIRKPLFAYLRYPMANNIDPVSPLGVSCYSRAVDLIHQADQQWSDLLWEFESGRRALYVDTLAFQKGSDGLPILPNRRLYRTLNQAGTAKEDLFKEWTPTLREANILSGLEAILRKIEFNCGLAYGTLSNPSSIEKTATELKISQQRMYTTVTDTQKALTTAIEQLLYSMDVWVTLMDLAPRGQYHVAIDYDDSVIIDKDTAFQQDLRLVTTNIMSKVEFRMRNFKEDEETARAKVADAAPEPEPGFGFGGPRVPPKPLPPKSTPPPKTASPLKRRPQTQPTK